MQISKTKSINQIDFCAYSNIFFQQIAKVSKIGDLSQGWPEGSLFNSYYTEV